jgi:diguanylate cyclase (GGDEF)-like protein
MTTTDAFRLLIIDDNAAIHDDFRKILKTSATSDLDAAEASFFGEAASVVPDVSYRMESALQGEEGFRRITDAMSTNDPFAVAFVDMRMPPGWDGLKTIEHILQADSDVQVVICSAFSDYSWDAIRARLGKTDRLLILKKPFDTIEVTQLAAALSEKWSLKRQAHLKMEELEEMVQERTEQLRLSSVQDLLTGLPNRAFLTEQLNLALARAKNDPAYSFVLLFLDFDRFKIVNDSLGHKVGDQLLIAAAQRLRECLAQRAAKNAAPGGIAVASRLGGDEFVILLDGVNRTEDIAPFADALLARLAEPYHIDSHELHVTASIGVALGTTGCASPGDLLRDADTAMYRAKSMGKNRSVFFDQAMHDLALSRHVLENDFRRAVALSRLQVHYQPIVSLATGGVVCFEALMRWQHPTRGLISPAEFIPLAEETGLILPAGRWILHESARQLRQWRLQFPDLHHLAVSVNLSIKQLIDTTLVDTLRGILHEYQLPPQSLKLEITESAVMDNPGLALSILEQIKALGVQLYLDDFGTGYSSLNCLHRFPIDALKVDRSFIDNVAERRDYSAVVHAIVELAHNLNIKLVAEGIENSDQSIMLQALECDLAQGYFFSRPLTASDATDFLANWQSSAMAISGHAPAQAPPPQALIVARD